MITLKLKFHDFSIITRSLPLDNRTNDQADIFEAMNHILTMAPAKGKHARLLGIEISNLNRIL